jgi:hypothetical protein
MPNRELTRGFGRVTPGFYSDKAKVLYKLAAQLATLEKLYGKSSFIYKKVQTAYNALFFSPPKKMAGYRSTRRRPARRRRYSQRRPSYRYTNRSTSNIVRVKLQAISYDVATPVSATDIGGNISARNPNKPFDGATVPSLDEWSQYIALYDKFRVRWVKAEWVDDNVVTSSSKSQGTMFIHYHDDYSADTTVPTSWSDVSGQTNPRHFQVGSGQSLTYFVRVPTLSQSTSSVNKYPGGWMDTDTSEPHGQIRYHLQHCSDNVTYGRWVVTYCLEFKDLKHA